MTSAIETLQPGRYVAHMHDRARFLAACEVCDYVGELSWGRSGSARAPAILRHAGWTLHGKTSRSRWHCPTCSGTTPLSSPNPPGRVPKGQFTVAVALDIVLPHQAPPLRLPPAAKPFKATDWGNRGRDGGAAAVKIDISLISRVPSEPCWHCGAARWCKHRKEEDYL